ncbi:MAG: tyrosine-protein phosphatase [Eubacteriales bacterium]|nr:tyrosine-protein phosphatase [Eubacteriales bacterium]
MKSKVRVRPGVLALTLVFLFLSVMPAWAAQPPQVEVGIHGLDNDVWFTKYGNVYCDCPAEELSQLGYEWGDLIRVQFLDQTLILPLVPTYSYVPVGDPALIMAQNEEGEPTGYLSFAVNLGSFAEGFKMAALQRDDEGNWWFEPFEGVEFPLMISLSIHEEDGFREEYLMGDFRLVRTDERADYAHLTDEQFANFRRVVGSAEGTSAVYRSGSPIAPDSVRSSFADEALQAAGIVTIVNLTDNREMAEAYPGYDRTYYSAQDIVFLNLGVNFGSEDFTSGLVQGMRHLAANEGPYLVHCTEGKDRAGFVSALLSCLMGASGEEVVADYMETYSNYYGILPGTDMYTQIAEYNILHFLELYLKAEDPATADLQAAAAEYLLAAGLSEEELAALMERLGCAPASDSVYVVQRGDCLSRIAAEMLGSASRWEEIFDANRDSIEDADLIYIGQELLLPNP